MQTTTVKTDYHQLEQLLQLLPKTPILIPICTNNKRPDVPEGESWKDPKFYLTPDQAVERLRQGKNVAVVGHDWLCIVDLDQPDKYRLNKKTLTVKTRSGGLHQYYLNDGTVENATGKNSLLNCGEVRTDWLYVIAPGSYLPHASGSGLYHIIEHIPPATLTKNDLPPDLTPNKTVQTTTSTMTQMQTQFTERNQYGWQLNDIINRDEELGRVLNRINPQDDSAEDMAALSRLVYWGYEDNEAEQILRKYRPRQKLDRTNYISDMLAKIKRDKHISKHVNIKEWHPASNNYPINTNNKNTPASDVPKEKETTKIRIDKIVNTLKKQYTFKTPTDTETIYYYNQNEGIYQPAEHHLKKLLENNFGTDLNSHHKNEIILHLKNSSYITRSEIEQNSDYMPFQNCLINLKTLEIKEFTPDIVFTYKIPITYNKNAQCPKWHKWLKTRQTPENIKLLQQWTGNCLLTTTSIQDTTLWMFGPGGTGKSTFNNTLQKFVGHQNCVSLKFQELNTENPFFNMKLYKKQIAFFNEPDPDKPFPLEMFKAISGGDNLEGEQKYVQQRINFIPYAKIIVTGNAIPKIVDPSRGFIRRALCVKWDNIVDRNDMISDIEKQWLDDPQEMSGILNWALQGLQQLQQQGIFTVTQSQQETLILIERHSDPISAWIYENLEFTLHEDDYITREKITENITQYYQENDIYKHLNIREVYDRLRQTGKTVDTKRYLNRELGTQRVFAKLRFKTKNCSCISNGSHSSLAFSSTNTSNTNTNTNSNTNFNLLETIEKPVLSVLSAQNCAKTQVLEAPPSPVLNSVEKTGNNSIAELRFNDTT